MSFSTKCHGDIDLEFSDSLAPYKRITGTGIIDSLQTNEQTHLSL